MTTRFPTPYPRIAHLTNSPTFGGFPCIRIPTRKIRAATHEIPTVAIATPVSPASGCHNGTPPGDACRVIIRIGVNGGTSDITSASVPFGC